MVERIFLFSISRSLLVLTIVMEETVGVCNVCVCFGERETCLSSNRAKLRVL